MADTDAEGDAEVNAELEYFGILDGILRTNPKKKLDNVLQKISERRLISKGNVASNATSTTVPAAGGGDNTNDVNNNQQDSTPRTGVGHHHYQKQCIISQVIKCNQHCISQIQIIRDNLLSAFMATTDLNTKSKSAKENITRQLSLTVGKLINLVSEASSQTQRIHENATGLHIAADFFRDPKELSILDFSKSGRIPVSHFSCIEATSMCLSWIKTSAEKLAEEETTTTEYKSPPIRNNFIKIYKSFERAMADLCEAGELASQIFRVLLYCNAKGKEMLRDYVLALKPQEVNDLITEIQMMRRQFDEINILMDRLGWSLADIWGRCTGKEVRFEDIRKEGCLKVKNFEEHEMRANKKKNENSVLVGGKKLEKKQIGLGNNNNMSKFVSKTGQSVRDEGRLLTKKPKRPSSSGTKSMKRVKGGTKLKKEKFSTKLELVLGKRNSDLSMMITGNKKSGLPPKSANNKTKTKKVANKKMMNEEKAVFTTTPRGMKKNSSARMD